MPRFATSIIIAGVDFTGCRALVENGEVFADSVVGSSNWGLDATPTNLNIDTGYKGAQFGINLGSDEGAITIVKLNQVLNAVKIQRQTNGYFTVVYVDEKYNLNLKCIEDRNQQWYTSGDFSEGWVKAVRFRFIVRTPNSVSLSS